MGRSVTLKFTSFSIIIVLAFLLNQTVSKRHEVKLDDKFTFGWEIHEDNSSIEIDCTGETLGYVGLGLSLKGKMDKAEMAIGGVDDNDNSVYHGVYTGHHHKVKLDKKKQWKLLEATQNETHTFMKYTRKLASSNLQVLDINEDDENSNIPIKDKDIYIIWALGKSDRLKKHHGHGKFKVNLIHPEEDFLTYFAEHFYDFVIQI